jgi:predicted DNA-binding transcriptional regulator YafY
MTPSERWPAILLQLEPDAWKRAEDLARALGVSERTVYRDVQAMVEAGVPLQGVPGKGYRVPEDYLLAPVTLTTDEAIMLILGSAYAAQNFDGRYRAAARSAERKLDRVLPAEARERAFTLQGSVHLVPPSAFGTPTEDGLLQRVRQALVEERTLEATTASGDGTETTRTLNPYGLVQKGASWYVVGYAPDRGRVAHLRLQEVEGLTLTDRTFQRPDSYRTPPNGPEPGARQTVRLLFAAEVAPQVQVAPSLQVAEREHTSDGRLLLTLRVDHEGEVLPWLLSWGRHVRVLAPRRLQQRLAGEARALADQYRDAPTLLDAPRGGRDARTEA